MHHSSRVSLPANTGEGGAGQSVLACITAHAYHCPQIRGGAGNRSPGVSQLACIVARVSGDACRRRSFASPIRTPVVERAPQLGRRIGEEAFRDSADRGVPRLQTRPLAPVRGAGESWARASAQIRLRAPRARRARKREGSARARNHGHAERRRGGDISKPCCQMTNMDTGKITIVVIWR